MWEIMMEKKSVSFQHIQIFPMVSFHSINNKILSFLSFFNSHKRNSFPTIMIQFFFWKKKTCFQYTHMFVASVRSYTLYFTLLYICWKIFPFSDFERKIFSFVFFLFPHKINRINYLWIYSRAYKNVMRNAV